MQLENSQLSWKEQEMGPNYVGIEILSTDMECNIMECKLWSVNYGV